MIISLWSAKNSTLPTELLWVKFKGSVFENVEFVFEISPQNPLFKCSNTLESIQNSLDYPLGLLVLHWSVFQWMNWRNTTVTSSSSSSSNETQTNTKPFPQDYQEIWVEGPRSDSSTEPKLKVIRRGAPPDPSSFEGPREEMRDGAPEYPSHSLLRDQRQSMIILEFGSD